MVFQKYFRGKSNSQQTSSVASTVIPLERTTPQTSSVDQSCATSLSGAVGLDLVKHEVMLNYLYQQQANSGWRRDRDSPTEGVVLRTGRDNYVTCPPELSESPLLESLRNLNVQVSIRSGRWSVQS